MQVKIRSILQGVTLGAFMMCQPTKAAEFEEKNNTFFNNAQNSESLSSAQQSDQDTQSNKKPLVRLIRNRGIKPNKPTVTFLMGPQVTFRMEPNYLLLGLGIIQSEEELISPSEAENIPILPQASRRWLDDHFKESETLFLQQPTSELKAKNRVRKGRGGTGIHCADEIKRPCSPLPRSELEAKNENINIWKHDRFSDEEETPRSARQKSILDIFNEELIELKNDVNVSHATALSVFNKWQNTLESIDVSQIDNDAYLILPLILHNLFHLKADEIPPPELIINYVFNLFETYVKIEFKRIELLKEIIDNDPNSEIRRFAKAIRAFGKLDGKIPLNSELRGMMTRIFERRLATNFSMKTLVRILASFEHLDISLSKQAQSHVLDYFHRCTYVTKPGYLLFIVRICAHYRLKVPRVIGRYLKLIPTVKDDISMLWNISTLVINDGINSDEAKSMMEELFKRISKTIKNIEPFDYTSLRYSISTFETFYGQDAPFKLDGPGKTIGEVQVNSPWKWLVDKLQGEYNNLTLEEPIALIDSPVDAYLELHEKKFIIQFDGPTHYLFNSDNRPIFQNGRTKAQTTLLEKNDYEVIRVDYFKMAEAFEHIKSRIEKHAPLQWREKKVRIRLEKPSNNSAFKKRRLS